MLAGCSTVEKYAPVEARGREFAFPKDVLTFFNLIGYKSNEDLRFLHFAWLDERPFPSQWMDEWT